MVKLLTKAKVVPTVPQPVVRTIRKTGSQDIPVRPDVTVLCQKCIRVVG